MNLICRNLTDYDAVGLIDGDAMVIAPIDEPYNILHITDYPLVGVHDLSHPDPKKVKVALEFTSGINAGGECEHALTLAHRICICDLG